MIIPNIYYHTDNINLFLRVLDSLSEGPLSMLNVKKKEKQTKKKKEEHVKIMCAFCVHLYGRQDPPKYSPNILMSSWKYLCAYTIQNLELTTILWVYQMALLSVWQPTNYWVHFSGYHQAGNIGKAVYAWCGHWSYKVGWD